MRAVVLFGRGLVAMFGVALFLGWWQVDGPGAERSVGKRPMPLSSMDFSLVDHQGNDVGPNTMLGKASLVFFGFTYCPDVCPSTLIDIAGWLDEIDKAAERLNVVFVTVDPERDTPAVLAEYVSNFHPVIRGWSGSSTQIRQMADSFRVFFEKVPSGSDGYVLNHTASVFLFGPDGDFVSTIDIHEPRDFAVPKIRRAIGLFEGQDG